MRSIEEPASLTSDERLSEVASILAEGILRLHARAALSGDSPIPKILPDSGPSCLEVPADTVLSVHSG